MTSNYGIFFSYGGQVLRLPVNPEELPTAQDSDNAEYNVLGIGPITIPRTPKQKEITFSGLLPGHRSSLVLTGNGFRGPEVYINFFQAALNQKRVVTYTPARYTEDGLPFLVGDSGFRCTVESFTYTEKGGETGDFYYDLTIREYRDYSPQRAMVQSAPAQAAAAVQTVVQEPTRATPSNKVVVGSKCIANGPYYYSSYGDNPHGNANGTRCTVSRIVDGSRAYPYHICREDGGALGWVKLDQLQVIS